MPVSAKKRKEMEQRIKHISFLIGLGMSGAEAGRRMGISTGQTVYAVRLAKKLHETLNAYTVLSSDDMLFSMLQCYATSEDEEMRALLKAYFPELTALRKMARGALLSHAYATTISGRVPPAYENLAYELFGPDTLWVKKRSTLETSVDKRLADLWEAFLRKITTKKSPIDSYRSAKYELIRMCSDASYYDVLLDFDAHAFCKAIIASIHTLLPREERVLQMYYGVDQAPMPINEIAIDFFVTGTRIHQIKAKALRKLKHPSRSKYFRGKIKTRKTLEERIDWLEKTISNLYQHQRIQQQKKSPIYWLDKDVVELELSVRISNCLEHADIKYIGELVQKSDFELSRIKNFGRKSLKEVKEILEEIGLTLGMDITGWTRPDS